MMVFIRSIFGRFKKIPFGWINHVSSAQGEDSRYCLGSRSFLVLPLIQIHPPVFDGLSKSVRALDKEGLGLGAPPKAHVLNPKCFFFLILQLELGKNDAEMAASQLQKEELEKLKERLKRQKAETDRLRGALDQAKKGFVSLPLLLFQQTGLNLHERSHTNSKQYDSQPTVLRTAPRIFKLPSRQPG